MKIYSTGTGTPLAEVHVASIMSALNSNGIDTTGKTLADVPELILDKDI